jgi:hypothetical protein
MKPFEWSNAIDLFLNLRNFTPIDECTYSPYPPDEVNQFEAFKKKSWILNIKKNIIEE